MSKISNVWFAICSAGGVVGGIIISALGGNDLTLRILVYLMIADFAMGITCAIANRSDKTDKGGLNSQVMRMGIAVKVGGLILVCVGHWVDLLSGLTICRNAVLIGLCIHEITSLLENGGALGLPIPKVLVNTIETLKSKTDE